MLFVCETALGCVISIIVIHSVNSAIVVNIHHKRSVLLYSIYYYMVCMLKHISNVLFKVLYELSPPVPLPPGRHSGAPGPGPAEGTRTSQHNPLLQ